MCLRPTVARTWTRPHIEAIAWSHAILGCPIRRAKRLVHDAVLVMNGTERIGPTRIILSSLITSWTARNVAGSA
jgi:hypothetical protein